MIAQPAPMARGCGRVSLMTKRERQWEADWECYHFNINRQDRKVTIRNIIQWGFSARDAIEMIHDCEREG